MEGGYIEIKQKNLVDALPNHPESFETDNYIDKNRNPDQKYNNPNCLTACVIY